MDIRKDDSDMHSLFSTLLNEHAAWNNMPTQNVGALQKCFEWFNQMGKRIDAGLEEAKSKADAELKTNDRKEKDKKVS